PFAPLASRTARLDATTQTLALQPARARARPCGEKPEGHGSVRARPPRAPARDARRTGRTRRALSARRPSRLARSEPARPRRLGLQLRLAGARILRPARHP